MTSDDCREYVVSVDLSSSLSHTHLLAHRRVSIVDVNNNEELNEKKECSRSNVLVDCSSEERSVSSSSSSSSSSSVSQRRPPLSPRRASFVLPTRTLIWKERSNSNDMQQGVDANIYHWKVLNLSRAKLKASSRTSALLSGFAMVAMVEVNIDPGVPEPLLITFTVCTVLLIAVHMLALMISTCILPNVESVANLHYQTTKTVLESPHTKMNFVVELAWAFSTVLGILLFLVEIAILCWVKFYAINHTAAWVATAMLVPIVIIFILFAAHFYLRLVAHKSEVYEDGLKELQLLKEQLQDDDEQENSNENELSMHNMTNNESVDHTNHVSLAPSVVQTV